MFCPKCGKQLNDNDIFCAFCGENLSGGGSPSNAQNTYSPPQQNRIQPSPQKFNGNAPKKKLNIALIIIIIILLLLVLIGAYILFIDPGYLLDQEGSSKDKRSSSTVIESGSSEITSSENETASVETTSTTEAVTSTTTSTTVTTTTVTSTQPTTTRSPEDIAAEEKNKVYDEAMGASTYERPQFSEFEWCFGQNGLVYTIPEDAEIISDPLGYSGGWKAMVIYNPSNSAGSFMRELDNIDISVSDDSCTITIDWYYMSIDGSESYPEDDMEDSVFSGMVTDTGLYASGQAEISINSLWKKDGCEYALGTIITSDGLPAYLAMVRP